MAKQKNKTNGPETKTADKNKFPPNLYLGGNGESWIVDFTFRGERYKANLGCVSRTVAKEMAAKRKTAAAEGRIVVNGKRWIDGRWIVDETETFDDLLFEAAMEKYLAWVQANRKPNTYVFSVQNAKPLGKFFGSYHLSQISPFLIERYKIERRKVCECHGGPKRKNPKSCRCSKCEQRIKSRANATLNRELSILQHLFNKSVDWKLARTNPMKAVDLFKEDNGRTRHLTQEEAERLLSACNEDFRAVVLVALHTGFRSSELKSLRWSSVDMQHRSVTVQSCYSKNSETRTVPMTDEVFGTFERLKAERDRKPEDLVFISRYGKPWKNWRTAFQNALERAGLKDFRFHDCRHTYASWLGMNNTNPKAMMELLGHRDITMTARYTHLAVDYKREAVAKLPKFGAEVLRGESPLIPPSTEEANVVRFVK